MGDRQPKVIVTVGEKGIGKTYQNVVLIDSYLKGFKKSGAIGKKVIIFDVNKEDAYSKYKTIEVIPPSNRIYRSPKDTDKSFALKISKYRRKQYSRLSGKNPRARRAIPLHRDGSPFTLTEMKNLRDDIFNSFYGGLLILEDLDKYAVRDMSQDMVGKLISNRHSKMDIMITHQSLRMISTVEWSNINGLRFHHTKDTVDAIKNRQGIEDKFVILKIAEKIIHGQYNQGNHRFFCYVDFDYNKVRGVPIQAFEIACKEYISENPGTIKALTNRIGEDGKRIYDNKGAYNHLLGQLKSYFPMN